MKRFVFANRLRNFGVLLALPACLLLAACDGGDGNGSPPFGGDMRGDDAPVPSLFMPVDSARRDLPDVATQVLTSVQAQPGVARAELTRLRPPAQIQSFLLEDVAEAIAIDAFGESIQLERTRIDRSARGTTEWFGRVTSVGGRTAGGSGIISITGENLSGTIFIGGREIGFNSVEGELAVIREIDPARLPPDEPPGFTDPIPNRPERGGQDANLTGTSEISLLVPVSEAAQTKILAAGYKTIDLFVEAAIGRAHLSFANSQIGTKFVPARVYLLSGYTESGNWDGDRDRFFAHSAAAAERKRLKADVSILIFDNADYCGEVKDIKATAATALSVVHWSCSVSNLSFAHELGHLFGAEHDPAHASSPPAFAYGHGYSRTDANEASKSWRTVMSYPAACGGCARIPYWSSPLIEYPPGDPNAVPMGTAARHDNARVLRDRTPVMSGFGDLL